MKKSMCCNKDMIYLGKGRGPIMIFMGAYIYGCSQCGKLEWSLNKEKCKYKWYKFNKKQLKQLLRLEEDNNG